MLENITFSTFVMVHLDIEHEGPPCIESCEQKLVINGSFDIERRAVYGSKFKLMEQGSKV